MCFRSTLRVINYVLLSNLRILKYVFPTTLRNMNQLHSRTLNSPKTNVCQYLKGSKLATQ